MQNSLLTARLPPRPEWTSVQPRTRRRPESADVEEAAAAAPLGAAAVPAADGGLWIGNLRHDTTSSCLLNVLQRFGAVYSVHMAFAPTPSTYDGMRHQWAIVKFVDATAAHDAIACLNGQVLDSLCCIPLKVARYVRKA